MSATSSNVPTARENNGGPAGTGGGVFRRAALRTIALLAIGFVLLDVFARIALDGPDLIKQPVEIASPATLYAKLVAFRDFRGPKWVVLGDSLVYGHALAEHGYPDWRNQVLTAQLERRLSAAQGGPVLVLNLGMNGLLPVDLERLMPLVVPLAPDLVLFDVTLRSLSAEFSAPGDSASRPWLADMRIDASGTLHTGASGSIDDLLRRWLVEHFILYRLRDFLQMYVLDGTPREAVRAFHERLNRALKGRDGADEGLLLLLKAKNRYARINLDASNPQLTALRRSLAYLAAAHQKTIVFYATENPRLLPGLTDIERHKSLLAGLERIIAAEGGRLTAYQPPLDELTPEHFLDHVHLNPVGYGILSSHLWSRLEVMNRDQHRADALPAVAGLPGGHRISEEKIEGAEDGSRGNISTANSRFPRGIR
jgi:lysophospholipase L1-like esterase